MARLRRAIGLMSGTSRDGIDAALLSSDGMDAITTGPALTLPYDAAFRQRLAEGVVLAAARGRQAEEALAGLAHELTELHAAAVRALLAAARIDAAAIDVIGFSGHTMIHRPAEGLSWQLGDAGFLAHATGIPVIADLRRRDIAAGGEGAPLAPVYHHARYRASGERPRPVATLNLGGVANVTWLDPARPPGSGLLAFDCGPGNALIDDWVRARTGRPFDEGGRLAGSGQVHRDVLEGLLAHPFFDRPPPKSLDRDAFAGAAVAGLSTADGAATLSAFTVAAIARASQFFPAPAAAWHVTGGGRHNATLMAGLARVLGVPVGPVEALGWNGDALEAELFAYLAIRSLAGLPISFPRTTGVPEPMTGGTRFDPGSPLPAGPVAQGTD
ncbi:MAG: anhydro-N-acetylmuramic acid kinase [Rhodothalassiaceae bacterium]